MAHSLPYSHNFATLKEGQMERFRMIYVWKIIKEFAPSCGVELTEENQNLGSCLQSPKTGPKRETVKSKAGRAKFISKLNKAV